MSGSMTVVEILAAYNEEDIIEVVVGRKLPQRTLTAIRAYGLGKFARKPTKLRL
jgi:hypothetical protein